MLKNHRSANFKNAPQLSKPMEGISVIVCCFNSSARLPQTIQHLAGQQVPTSISWEIILVNNSSTDDTSVVAKNEWQKYNLPNVNFIIVDETKPGLSYARHKGIENSAFGYLVFCDDDNWLDKNYLYTAYNLLSGNKKIACVGGQSIAVSNTYLPAWFEASKSNYAVGAQAKQSGDVTSRKFLWGSGIALRKNVYLEAFANFPSLLTGRKGKELTSGEDSEICMRSILMGYQLFYSEELIFKHFIAEERLTENYNNKLVEGFIKAYEVLKIYATFIDIHHLKLRAKYYLFTKSLFKVLINNTFLSGSRNVSKEQINIFIISGIKFKSVDKIYVNLRKLTQNIHA